MKSYDIEKDLKYLKLLSNSFPTIAEASTEIINLAAILNLPKGTEHFLADVHGEYEAFRHVLKNASGTIKRKVNELFGNSIRENEKRELCSLIYYPEEKLQLVKAKEKDINDWYHMTINNLVEVCRDVSSKYTRSKVRKSLPVDFSYIIQELLQESPHDYNKTKYVNAIIDAIILTGRADDFIIAISKVIQRLAVDRLHILGDLYDRGPGAHVILDTLKEYHRWDIQWGNHDILWMGASVGNRACLCNVIRISLRYANLTTLEEGYGINLVPLATFAMETYGDDPCQQFTPRVLPGRPQLDEKTFMLDAAMHKAISVIQFKVEAQLFRQHKNWHMENRNLLKCVDYEKGTITLEGKTYELTDKYFPTIDPEQPEKLTEEEELLMKKLCHSFMNSEKLQRHMKLLLGHGSMSGIYNNNLLFHASIPLNEDGSLKDVEVFPGKFFHGSELMRQIEILVRLAFHKKADPSTRDYAIDYFLYLWSGQDSPLFDKSKMTTFERYFIKDPETHYEEKGNYFKLRDKEEVIDKILKSFGVTGDNAHIINGHVPVHASKGENPIKANGKLMVIDGGFSKAYHKETGIAGYTLVYHSRGFQLVQHEPFVSTEEAIEKGTDIISTTEIIEVTTHAIRIANTDTGETLKQQIADLQELLYAYQNGILKEGERNPMNDKK